MKLDARRIEGFLADPGATKAVLLHGDDAGLVADRASRLVRAVAGATDDPFRVVELDRDGLGRMAEEMASQSLTGGRRVVRVREATDALTARMEVALAGGGTALLVLEAASLPSRSRLRTAVERSTEAVAIGCYPPDGTALERQIRSLLGERGATVDAATLAWLGGRLGGDLAGTRMELEKLLLYVGPSGSVDLAAAQACTGDFAAVSLEDALFAATAGEVENTDRALDLAMTEGAAPVAVLRAALGHVQRLHRARIAVARGTSAAVATAAQRPPIFFRREPMFLHALRLWPETRLAAAAVMLARAEAACKRTGAPAEAICRHAILGLALRSPVQRGPMERGPMERGPAQRGA